MEAKAYNYDPEPEGKAIQKWVRPEFKIVYLIVVAIVALAVRNALFNLSLFGLQIIFWAISGFRRRDLEIFRKAIPYCLAIVFFQAFFETPKDLALFSLFDHDFYVSTQGFHESLFMVVRFLTIICASAMVRSSTSSHEFVEGLTRLKVSKNMAMVLDSLLSIMEGRSKGQGQGGGRKQGEKKPFTFKTILRGDFSFLHELIQRRLQEAKEKFVDHDWAVIAAISMVVVGIRLVQVLPGLPFAPGNKNAILIPLYVLAAALSKKKFSATYVGLLSGIMGFMFGQGKYGVLGVLQFLVPGLVVDLMIPLTRVSRSLFVFALIGFCAGLARVSVEVLLALIFGLPGAFFAFFTPFLISQCGFGVLSAPVSKYFVNHIKIE